MKTSKELLRFIKALLKMGNPKNISKHISYSEATNSNTANRKGITNKPTPEILNSMEYTANRCFEPLREWYGKPIRISSFYRCKLLNNVLGGSKTSQHPKGEAIDMTVGTKEGNKKIYDWCKANIEFDQLINEYDYSWVHISIKKKDNRNQTFKIT